MTNQHPITPPPELVLQWSLESQDEHQPTVAYSMVGLLAAKAARWGADHELEACCEWLFKHRFSDIAVVSLRDARRPKPPSLKEQAIKLVETYECPGGVKLTPEQCDTIRRALEALDD